ncbi:tripartite-type tricarboxylate transporter receptor subunit TctC [Variovorax boronicumulans]|uniref:Tripartite-type tricarboxylate transporter receptor subunit TctC n=1 Tax=Variovorax boronicumulans TaxID=436515 RepID=A0AAW8DUN8_9BURK|nr:tripartite tricarboxylate transporter substrate binding protein [Variovorax boronicumulans]MDP9877883.1 tripartite-type tricarboxylate transporter receptor subunit TctC [Variovorax boronicumulans]MDP9923167.1 tripartite-type tricarboxylate transporter receptor subunit TctC [Variovorax boronicumulans]
MTRRALLAGGAATLLCALRPRAFAQAFPRKPLRLIVPFPAGGGTDAMARALGDALSRDLGQPVVVDNKSGAGTVIGNDAAAKSPPDGHTLLLNTSAIAIVPSLHPKLPYPTRTAFSPVVLLGRAPNVAIVRPDSPLRSAADFVAKARAHPGRMSYGSAGNGTSTHLAAELLKSSAQLFVTHVPYRGAAPVINDVLAGQIDLAFGTLPSVAPMLTGGKLRALAVTSAQRSPLLPDVPTFAESGVTGYDADVWYGIFVPGATPPAVVEQLYAAVRRAAQTEGFKRRAAAEGLALTLDGPLETARIVRAEEAKWRHVIKTQSITLE